MLLSVMALGAMLAPRAVEAHVSGASLFKNGYAVVTREIDVAEPGEYTLAQIPQGSLGTLWFSTTEGTRLAGVVTTLVDETKETALGSLDGILRANVGKELHLTVQAGEGPKEFVGTLLSAEGDILVLQSGSGQTTLQKASVTRVESPSGGLVYKTTVTSPQRALRFKVEGRPGKIVITSLERGLTWAPGYAVDLKGKKTLTLTAKATVMDDLDDLNGVEARFITGFPNVPYAQWIDPLVSGQDVNAFLAMVSGVGVPPSVFSNRAGDMVTQNAYSRADAESFAAAMPPAPLGGEQHEDLFFYRQPDIRLKKGDRGYYVLFRADTPYSELYCWDIDDMTSNNVDYHPVPSEPGEVWHALEFKNTSGQPLTTGAATVFQQGEVVGQDMMHYVPNGGQAELRINKSLDVQAQATEAEESRQRGAIKNPNNFPLFDLVTLKGTLVIANHKTETVKLRIRKDLTGEVTATTGDPQLTKTVRGLQQINPGAQLVWIHDIDPGKSLKLTYTYQMYVRSQS